MKLYRTAIVSSLLWLTSPALAQDPEVGVAPIPDWVIEHEVIEFGQDRSAQFQQGMEFLLHDRQVRKTGEGFEVAQRIVYRILDRSGLEAGATVSQVFDPAEESLAFNYVRIIRDGQVIDQLEQAEITLLRQEEGLAIGIIDGNYTALINLNDVRVGDTVDYSMTRAVESKLWPDEYFESVPMAWTMPLASYRYRLLMPADEYLDVRSINTDVTATRTTVDNWAAYEITVIDPDPITFEANVPFDYLAFGLVSLTTNESWAEVVDWAVPLFDVDDELPDSFLARLDEIAAAHSEPGERTVEALRLVQDDIRYLGLETDLGSHVPRSPLVTLERGYGDCKDKSVLLVAALKYLGIQAAPALVSTGSGHLLPELLPMIGNFDHVIVGVTLENEVLWVDPTISYQGGRANSLVPLDYGYVLPVRNGQTSLVKLETPMPTEPGYVIEESFAFPDANDNEGGIRFDLSITYRGNTADYYRGELAYLGEQAIGRSFRDYYASLYVGLREAGQPAFEDSLDENRISFSAQYAIDRQSIEENNYLQAFPIYSSAIQNVVPTSVEADRSAPLGLSFGSWARHRIRLSAPGRNIPLDVESSQTESGITYLKRFDSDGENAEMLFEVSVTERVADVASIKSVTRLGNDIQEAAEYRLNLGVAVPTYASFMGLPDELDAEIERQLQEVGVAVYQKDHIAALTGINRLLGTEQLPTLLRGHLLQMKGLSLFSLNRPRPAAAAFAEGIELSPPESPQMYLSYMGALSALEDAEKIAAVLVEMLTRLPESIESLNVVTIRRLAWFLADKNLDNEHDALISALAEAADAARGDALWDFEWVFADAVRIAIRADDVERAQRLVTYVRSPKDVAALYSNAETESVWEAIETHAGNDLSKVVEQFVNMTALEALGDSADFEKKANYLTALRLVGDFDQATTYAEPIVSDWATLEAVGVDAFWMVSHYADLLSDAGQPDRADALFSNLQSLGLEYNPALVPMAINRAIVAIDNGRFSHAHDLLEQIDSWTEDVTDEYFVMWLRFAQACSLHQVGRVEEAADVIASVPEQLADANPEAMAKTLLCLDKQEQAADLLVERLSNPDQAEGALEVFWEFETPPNGPTFLLELLDRARQVKNMDRVQTALSEVGRAIAVPARSTAWGNF